MSVSEAAMPMKMKKAAVNYRALGIVGMICAPALSFGSFFHSQPADSPNPYQIFASLGGLLYLSGATASAIAMRRLRVTGNGTGAGVLFVVQVVGLLLAMMFDVFEYAAPQIKETTVFFITDMAYPFSHILMVIVGIVVVKASVWRGWRCVPAFLIGAALPLFLAASAAFGRENTGWIFIGLVTLGFFALGMSIAVTGQEVKR
jgi:hypothetical protein